jgi:hypothetical protein
MSIIADIIRALAATGATIEQIAAAVEVIERDQIAKEEARKAKGRERVRKHRDMKRGVTLPNVTDVTTPSPPLSPLPSPQTPNPSPLNPPTPTLLSLRDDCPPSSKTKKTKGKKAPAYTPDFELFWTSYPRRIGTSKAEAFEVWNRLSPDDRDAAVDGMLLYSDHITETQTPERFIVHAVVFLRQRRWETLQEVAS